VVRLFLFLLALSLVSGGYILPGLAMAQADDNEIEVLSQRAESDFPDGVRFFIEARSPDEIEEVRVFFKKLGQTSRSSYRLVEFEPGKSISGESVILSGRSGEYIPPGTRIEYSFEIRDKAGRVYRSQDEVFIYLDNRFEWKTVSNGLITVFYYGDAEARAQTMLETAQETLQRMRPVLGIDPEDPLHIVTYTDYRHMADALPFRAQAVQERLITQGMAFNEERVLLVHGFDSTYVGTTSHEFTHLLVADAAGRAVGRVPSWLNEGLAEYGNVEASEDYDQYLRNAVARGQLRPLWHQTTFSGTPEEIIVAYGQGKSVVEYMLATYGPEKMAGLIDALKMTFDIDKALEQVYGFDQYGLDSEWRISLGLEPLPPPEGQQPQEQPTPAPTLPPTPAPPPANTPTATSQPTPMPEASPAASTENRGAPQASPGCSAPSHPGRMATDLAVLALLGGPLAMLYFRKFHRR
jgi:hypothetical protein